MTAVWLRNILLSSARLSGVICDWIFSWSLRTTKQRETLGVNPIEGSLARFVSQQCGK